MRNLRAVGTTVIDKAGRIVIPKLIRKALDIEEGDELDMFFDGTYFMVKKYVKDCVLCGKETDLIYYRNYKVCADCIEILHTILEEELKNK